MQIPLLQQKLPQQVLIPGGIELFAQVLDHVVAGQVQKRVALIQPAVQGLDGPDQALGLGGLLQAEGQTVDGRLQLLPVDALPDDPAHRLPDDLADPGDPVLLGVAHPQLEAFLGDAVAQAHRNVLAQALVQEGALDRRVVAGAQDVGKQAHAVQGRLVLKAGEELAQHQVGLFLAVLALGDLIGPHRAVRRADPLGGDGEGVPLPGKAGQIAVDQGEGLFQGDLAVQPDVGVLRVVKALVRGDELLVAQLRDVLGVSARVKAVAAFGEEGAEHLLLHHLVHGAHGPLHLVEHHALVDRLFLAVRPFDVPALLLEDAGVMQDGRGEHGVQIDLRQVQEVRLVQAGHRVHGLVRKGHRVQEGVHAALDQLHERLPDGILVAAAEHRVLQDVKHAGIVLRQGLKRDGKQLVFLQAVKIAQLRARLFVGHLHQFGVQFVHPAHPVHHKAVKALSNLPVHSSILLSLEGSRQMSAAG